MVLRDINIGHEAKCTCEICRGTGILKGLTKNKDIGVICSLCYGTGYYTLDINDEVQLVREEETGAVFEIKRGMIEKPVQLFHDKVRRNDTKYVMWGTDNDSLLNEKDHRESMIPYEDFYLGKLPMPNEQYSCPEQFMRYYRGTSFKECDRGNARISECKKFGSKECWDYFYGTAATPYEVQAVLQKVKQR